MGSTLKYPMGIQNPTGKGVHYQYQRYILAYYLENVSVLESCDNSSPR